MTTPQPPIVQPLLDIQETDAHIRDLKKEIDDIPRRRAEEEGRLNDSREACARAEEAHKLAQVNASNCEGEIEDLKALKVKLLQQQTTLKNNREFAAMTTEIGNTESEIEAAESRLVNFIDETGAALTRLGAARNTLAEETAVVEEAQRELDERLAEAETVLAGLEARRHELAAACTQQMLLVYSRLLKSRWPPVVPLENGTCGGCHLTQPPSVSHLVRRNQNLVTCQMCGRILY